MFGVRAPHSWVDLTTLLVDIDPEHSTLPDWVLQGGQVADETGGGTSATSTAILDAALYGPVCASGTWPNLDFVPGEPVTFS